MNVHSKRLKWACRRGMLELDVLLDGYLENYYLADSPELQAQFEGLLTCHDPDLFDWLVKKEPPDVEFALIVSRILRQTP